VPAVPSCLLEPIWVEFRVLLGAERPPFDLTCDTIGRSEGLRLGDLRFLGLQ